MFLSQVLFRQLVPNSKGVLSNFKWFHTSSSQSSSKNQPADKPADGKQDKKPPESNKNNANKSSGSSSSNNNNKNGDDDKLSSLLVKAFLWMLTAYMFVALVSLVFPGTNQPEVKRTVLSINFRIELKLLWIQYFPTIF